MKRSTVVAILLMAACGGNSEDPKPTGPKPSAPQPAAAADPVFDPQTFVGSWKATIKGSRVKRQSGSLDVPVGDAPSFAFSILRKDGGFFLEGQTPMALKSVDQSLVGESRGVAVRLTYVPPGIAGEITRKSSDSDSALVLEFEADRVP